MKIKSKELNREKRNKFLDAFYFGVKHAKDRDEIKSFLNDLLTESEKIMLGRRLLIAKRLLERKPHDVIVREMNVGLDTVYRVQKWLGGRHVSYKKVVEKIKKVTRSGYKKGKMPSDYYPTSGMADIRRRYGSYYWISNLLEEINED